MNYLIKAQDTAFSFRDAFEFYSVSDNQKFGAVSYYWGTTIAVKDIDSFNCEINLNKIERVRGIKLSQDGSKLYVLAIVKAKKQKNTTDKPNVTIIEFIRKGDHYTPKRTLFIDYKDNGIYLSLELIGDNLIVYGSGNLSLIYVKTGRISKFGRYPNIHYLGDDEGKCYFSDPTDELNTEVNIYEMDLKGRTLKPILKYPKYTYPHAVISNILLVDIDNTLIATDIKNGRQIDSFIFPEKWDFYSPEDISDGRLVLFRNYIYLMKIKEGKIVMNKTPITTDSIFSGILKTPYLFYQYDWNLMKLDLSPFGVD